MNESKSADQVDWHSDRLLRAIIDTEPECVKLVSSDGTLLRMNPAGLAMIGADSPEQALGQSVYNFVALEHRSAFQALIEKVFRGEAGTLEFEIIGLKGARRWMDTHAVPLRGENNEIVALLSITRDITERKQTEVLLRRQALVFENMHDAVVLTDAQGYVIDWNEGAERLTGYRKQDVVGRPIGAFHPPHLAPALSDQILEGIQREGRWAGRIPIMRRDGTRAMSETHIVPLRTDGGTLTGLISVSRDVTARHEIEENLEHTVSLLNATLESTADGLLVVDRHGRTVTSNQRFAEMWRIPREVVAERDDQKSLAFVLDQLSEPEAFLAKVRELYAQPETESFDVLEFKDGRIFERYSKPQRVGGESIGRVWSFRDVTEGRRIEEQLRLSQRLEAIGKLAGGVAHDFNNLLTAILGYGNILADQLGPQDRLRHYVDEIRRAGERAAALTQQLLAFSRQQVLQPKILDLNALLRGMDSMLRRLIREDVDLVMRLDPQLGRVRADPGQLEQVIVNLTVNARDAMPKGGAITIETTNETLHEPLQVQDFVVLPGSYVKLSVSDTGMGMDEETRARIFEPFFTTKVVGQGTGLGLATVYGIVKQSAGFIWAESTPGKGTTFRVYLPEASGASEEAPRSTAARASGGRETLLVVEDEDSVRRLACMVLAAEGYRVLEASSALQALDVAKQNAGLELLITDVIMPKINGRELAARLRSSRPRLRVLYMSGYTDEEITPNGLDSRATQFLQKPFTPDGLLRKVREILDSPE